jgi:tellurite resistance protein
MAAVAAGLGYHEEAQLAFGGALFSWLSIESVLLHRLYTASTLSLALRPTLGIQLAPPAVGAVAYLGVSGGAPDIISRALLGYALLQALLLLRLLPWIMKQPFGANYWSFTFGTTALAAAPMLMIEHGEVGAIARIAPYLFVAANCVVGLVAAGTLRLMAKRRLLPKSASVSLPQPRAA